MESPTVRRNLKRKCSDITKGETPETKESTLRRKLPSTRMQKTPSDPTKTPTTSRITNSTPKKKSSANRGLKGQKWFKGSPRSRLSHRMRPSQQLLKSSPQDTAPQAAPLPPSIVEFEFGESSDRIHVLDVLTVTEKEHEEHPGTSRELSFKDVEVTPVASTPPPQPIVWSSSLEKKGSRSVASNKGKTFKSKIRSSKKLDQPKQKNAQEPQDDKNSNPAKLPEAKFRIIKDFKMSEAPPRPNAYIRYMERPIEELADEVEYDLDEEDCAWLELVNAKRRDEKLSAVMPESMELLMDRLEKESYFQMQSTGMDQGPLIDDDAVCCICMDGECQNSNAILFCDMCNLAVHQECYGVPYIPEGQWLCRRCLQSPSRAVDCALCPNKGGAFKQTDDGRWAHVVCAIWIPEVCFANTVFLEPVDSIGNIPPARWRLSCYVCKQKGVGACIQCHKSNCYTAFHVTCAQQADLCMKMDTVREGSSVIVKKTAYCDNHAPPVEDSPSKDGDGTQSPRQKMRQTRKLLAEKRCAIPVVSIPTIPLERIDQISSNVSFKKKRQFVKRLMSYWKLKRSSRNGVPLLRRLQAASVAPRAITSESSARPIDASEMAANQAYYQYFMRLRQDLERARLLCELIRKREKVKRELIYVQNKELNLKLRPFTLFLLNVVDEIASKDSLQIFAEPVNAAEVTDYLTVVKQPMDLATMREKVNSFQYSSVEELECDFNLMIDNCLLYNSKDTIFHRSGVKLKELGGIIIRQAKREFLTIGYDPDTGLHLPERPSIPEVLTDREIAKEVENILDDKERFSFDQQKHITLLEDVLDKTLSLTHPVTKKNRYARIKQEISRVKRWYEQKEQKEAESAQVSSVKVDVKRRIVNRLGRKPNSETPSKSDPPAKGKSAYDFELSDEYENSTSPAVTSEAWRKRFPNSKSAATISTNEDVQLTPSSVKNRDHSVSTDSSPTSNKRALRPPKQKTTPVSSPSPNSTSRASNVTPSTPKRSIVERKSPARKNLAVSQFMSNSINKLGEKVSPASPNKTNPPTPAKTTTMYTSKTVTATAKTTAISPNKTVTATKTSTLSPNKSNTVSPVKKFSANKSGKIGRPKLKQETEKQISQYSRREQKEMRAAVMTHQKVSISMALAAAQQITCRDAGELKDRNSAKCKPLANVSTGGANKSASVLANKYKRPKLANMSAIKYKKSTNGVANNTHINDNYKSPVNSRADSKSKTPSPSPTRRNLSRIRNSVVDIVNDKKVAKHSSSNNNNNVHWSPTNSRNRSNACSVNNHQKHTSPNNNSGNCVTNNYNNSPIRTVTNNISSAPKKRKNVGKSAANSVGGIDSANERPGVDKTDSFMVYRSGGTNEMDSNSEDDDRNNDEDEEEADEEADESGEESGDESEEDEEEAEEPVVEEKVVVPKKEERQSGPALSESESSAVTSGLSSKSSSSDSSDDSDSGSSSSSDSESSSSDEIPAHIEQKHNVKHTTIAKGTVTNNVKKRRSSGTSTGIAKLTAAHYERPVYSPDVTAPVSAQISYRKRVEEYERNLKEKKGIVSKCQDHVNCSKVIYAELQEEEGSSCESDISSDITSHSKTTHEKKPKTEDSIVGDAREKKHNTLAIALQPLDLVWARCKEGYSYPALIINPEMPVGFTQNGVAIPGPPREILEKRPRLHNPTEQVFLVLFFDHKRSWEWITRSKLQQLGMDPSLDKERLMEIRKPSEKKAVRRAYEKAILHRCRVNGSRTLTVDNIGD